MKKIIVACTVSLICGGLYYAYDTLAFWGEQAVLNGRIEREVYSIGKKAAEKTLWLARPWLLAQSADPRVNNKAEEVGEFRARIEALPDRITLDSREGPKRLIESIQEEYAFSLIRVEKPFGFVSSDDYEVVKRNPGFRHAAELERVWYQLDKLLFESYKCSTRRQLRELQARFETQKSQLEALLAKEVPQEKPTPEKKSV